jgi:hypothetical protein
MSVDAHTGEQVAHGQAGFLFLDVHAYIQAEHAPCFPCMPARLSDSLNPKPARACSMPLSPTNTNTAKIIRQPVIKRSIFFSLQVGRYRSSGRT